MPVHDPQGLHKDHLTQLVSSILEQDLTPLEVVLSANHEITYFQEISELVGRNFPLRFFKNDKYGSAANTNYAVKRCTGDIVKIMHQDDFFSATGVLRNISKSFNHGKHLWQVTAFDHLIESNNQICRPMIPKISKGLISGRNTIGAPSVAAFRTESFIPFDERMMYMFDCDWYLAMWHNFGKPYVTKALGIRIRIHDGQATNWAATLFETEVIQTRKNHLRACKFFLRSCNCIAIIE